MQPIFKQSEVEDIYDSIDMVIETFFYIPIIFICNIISIFVLHYRYERSEKFEYWQHVRRLRQQHSNDIWQTGIYKHKHHNGLPHLNELKVDWCSVGDAPQPYLNNLTKQSKKDTILIHRRIVAEFNMSLVTLVDQIFDAVGVLFYLLFWGALHNWISVDSETVLLLYDICWELGTTTQPFLLLLMCPQVRKAFVNYYSVRFTKVSYCLTKTVSCLARSGEGM
uniref:G_PROTEIN_RECEP_F1_2 domain-containing protein n=1 Tax=Panagrellus redivivus TaxID=6233 RepID=A0A7E4W7B3_PANRE